MTDFDVLFFYHQIYAWHERFEGKRVTQGAFALISDGRGRVLLGQRGYPAPDGRPVSYPGYLNLIGGGVEEGETPHAAVVRETLEETSIDITADGFTVTAIQCPLYLFNEKTQSVDVAHSFFVEPPGEVFPRTSYETIAFHWTDGKIMQDDPLIVCGPSTETPGRTPMMIAFGLSLTRDPISIERIEDDGFDWIRVGNETISRKRGEKILTYPLLRPVVQNGKLVSIE